MTFAEKVLKELSERVANCGDQKCWDCNFIIEMCKKEIKQELGNKKYGTTYKRRLSAIKKYVADYNCIGGGKIDSENAYIYTDNRSIIKVYGDISADIEPEFKNIPLENILRYWDGVYKATDGNKRLVTKDDLDHIHTYKKIPTDKHEDNMLLVVNGFSYSPKPLGIIFDVIGYDNACFSTSKDMLIIKGEYGEAILARTVTKREREEKEKG